LPASYRQCTHGYAVTSYAAQGQTVDHVVFSDSTSRPATSAQQWYVTISRGRKGTSIFTSEPEQLRTNIRGHAGRMNYQTLDRRGWPIASGTAESSCRSRQCRRKRPGQFWTRTGLRHLDALEEARDNGHWDELWLTP
jgi:hypothetical protein